MKADAEAYLGKARESLASAEADLEAGRFNSVANRSYYSAFQAAISLLIENGIRPRSDSWDHRFVISEFSGRLIRRRKVISAGLAPVLGILLERRLRADYRSVGINRSDARDCVVNARALLHEVGEKLEG